MPNIGNFDPNANEPIGARELLPTGWYAMQIVDSQVNKSKTGDGGNLQLVHEIVENVHPEHKGRKVSKWLTLWNSNPETVRIANGNLSQICKSIGQVENVTDSSILHFRQLAVKIGIKAAEGKYSEQNQVEGYDSFQSRFQPGVPGASIPAGGTGSIAPPPGAAPLPSGGAAMPPGTQSPAGMPPGTNPPQAAPQAADKPPWDQ